MPSKSKSPAKRKRSPTKKAQRTFTVERSNVSGHTGGVYKGTSPLAAARKAATRIFRDGRCREGKVVVYMKETTSGSPKRGLIKSYTASNESVNETVVLGGKTIPIYNKSIVRAGGTIGNVNSPKCGGGVRGKQARSRR